MSLPRAWRCRRGTAALEFAIVAPVFLLAMMFAIEVGWQMWVGSALDYGVRRASRSGAVGTIAGSVQSDTIKGMIVAAAGGVLQPGRLSVTLDTYASWTNSGANSGRTTGGGSGGQVVRYTARYTQPLLTPFARLALANASNLVHTSVLMIQNEPYPTN